MFSANLNRQSNDQTEERTDIKGLPKVEVMRYYDSFVLNQTFAFLIKGML